jgi:hypothetical protein
LASKPLGQFLIGLGLRTTRTVSCRFGLKTGGDGFWWASKPAVTVFAGLASKPVVTISGGLASKPAATVSSGLTSKPAATVFSDLASKQVARFSLV